MGLRPTCGMSITLFNERFDIYINKIVRISDRIGMCQWYHLDLFTDACKLFSRPNVSNNHFHLLSEWDFCNYNSASKRTLG